MQAILGLITALPQLVSFAQEIWTYLQKISGNDVAGFLIRSQQAVSLLNSAQTEDDHRAAAKALADLIGRSPAK